MGFLDGLKKLGLDSLGLEEENLFEEPVKKPGTGAENPSGTMEVFDEASLLFDRKYTCPVCETAFTSKTMKSGKIRVKRQDVDLRSVYEEMDPVKYEVVTCPECGYSAVAKHFGNLTKFQIEEVKTKIGLNYEKQDFGEETYSYEDARSRYELAIASAMVKKARFSEKAYLCLKMAWLLRGESEHLDPSAPLYERKKRENKTEEKELLKKALDGFQMARMKEAEIEGMDATTVDYLMAALALETEDYQLSLRMIGNILTSRTATTRIKDKANDLKELVREKQKAAGATADEK